MKSASMISYSSFFACLTLLAAIPGAASGVELPEFVEAHQSSNSFITYDGFYQFITPIVRSQRNYLQQHLKDHGSSDSADAVARRFNDCYLSALKEMKLSSRAEQIERFMVLVFTHTNQPELLPGCVHYFRAIGTLKADSLMAINDYVNREQLPDSVLPLFYEVFEQQGFGFGQVSMPPASKRRLLNLQWTTKIREATGRKEKLYAATFGVEVCGSLILSPKVSEDEKMEICNDFIKLIDDWKDEGYVDDVLDLLVRAATEFDAFSEELPESIRVVMVEFTLEFIKMLIKDDAAVSDFKRVRRVLTYFAGASLQVSAGNSEVYDILKHAFLSDDSSDTAKVLIAPNFTFLDHSDRVVDEEVLRLWSNDDLPEDIRYELLRNLIDGKHPQFKALLLEEVSSFERRIQVVAEELDQDAKQRLAFLTGQLGRILKMQEVDVDYLNKDPKERLLVLRSSGRLKRLE